MKQNILLFSTLVAGLMTTSACNDEQLSANSANESAEMITVSSTARMPQGNPSTKLNLEEKYEEKIVEITWREDADNPETFSVMRGDGDVNLNLFTFNQMDATSNNHTASFTGEIFPDKNATYYAIYPATSSIETSVHNIRVDFNSQTGELDESRVYMYAESPLGDNNTLDFNFQHLTSIIKVKMLFATNGSSNATVKPTTRGVAEEATLTNITLSAAEKFIISGTVDALTGEARSPYNPRNNISIRNDRDFKEYVDSVYIHLLPGTYSGLTISAKVGDVTYAALLSNNKELKAGIMYEATAEMQEETVVSVSDLTADAISDSYNLKVTGTLTDAAITIIKNWAKQSKGLLDLSEAIFPDNELNGFSSCRFAKILLPNSITSIGTSAFYTAELQSINIPENITSIGTRAFMYSILQNITIPESVTSIGESAFYCTALQSVKISASNLHIGDYAFQRNSDLRTVICEATKAPTLGTDVFSEIADESILYIPKGSTESYTTNGWTSYFTKVVEMTE